MNNLNDPQESFAATRMKEISRILSSADELASPELRSRAIESAKQGDWLLANAMELTAAISQKLTPRIDGAPQFDVLFERFILSIDQDYHAGSATIPETRMTTFDFVNPDCDCLECQGSGSVIYQGRKSAAEIDCPDCDGTGRDTQQVKFSQPLSATTDLVGNVITVNEMPVQEWVEKHADAAIASHYGKHHRPVEGQSRLSLGAPHG